MDVTELTERLRRKGYRTVNSAVNREGRMVYYIEVAPERRVAMFHEDAVDLVAGRATMEEIAARNKNADLAEPWRIA